MAQQIREILLARLSPLEASSLLSLLDRFDRCSPWEAANSPEDSFEEEALWNLDKATVLEHEFLIKSHRRLKLILHQLGLTMLLKFRELLLDAGEEDVPYLCIAQMSDTKGLTYLMIESIKREIEKYLYAPGTFDYIQFANQHLKAGVEALLSSKEYIRGENLLDQEIQCHPIQPAEKGIGMANFEVNFQAAGTKMIVFPDANKFTEEHEAVWLETAARPNRLYRDYMFCTAYAILHELIHCVQYAVMGGTTLDNIWKKEYAACHAQMNFMALASKTLKHLYPDGLVEEIVLFYWEIVMKLHCVIPDDIKQAYCSWRDSCGVQDPVSDDAAVFLNENRAFGYYLKARLALEHFDGGLTFHHFVDAHFSPQLRHLFPGRPLSPSQARDLESSLSKPALQPVDWASLFSSTQGNKTVHGQ